MAEFLSTPTAQLVIWSAALAGVILVGIYAINAFRGGADDSGEVTHQVLSNFRDLHSEGELSDEEFRTIKSMLAERSRHEVSGNGDQG